MIYQFNLSFSLSLLFMGFLLANIFGILTNNKNIIFLFVLSIEIINYFVYSKPNNKTIKPFSKFFKYFLFNQTTPMYFFYPPFKKLSIFKSSFRKASPCFTKAPLKQMDGNIKYSWWCNQTKKTSIILSAIISTSNFLKIGFEFGFFIDAFKLGS